MSRRIAVQALTIALLLSATQSALAQSSERDWSVRPQSPSGWALWPAAVAQAALGPGGDTLLELERLQAREVELRGAYARHSMVGPAVGLSVSIPSFLVMLPLGSFLVAVADDQYFYTESEGVRVVDADNRKRVRTVGAVLLSASAIALAGIALCARSVRRTRREKREAERELNELFTRRAVLIDRLQAPRPVAPVY